MKGLVATGDQFISDENSLRNMRKSIEGILAVEMEGAAIGQTCHMLDTPFLVIRSLSDIAGKTSSVSFKEYLDTAAKHSAQLVMAMIKALAK